MTRDTSSGLGRRGVLAAAALPLLGRAALARQAAAPAGGGAEISVAGAREAPIPIAIAPFGGAVGGELTDIVNNDLASSGLFRPLGDAASATNPDSPDFATFRQLGARALVTGTVSGGGAGVVAAVRIWDVNAGTQLQGTQFSTSTGNARRIAHKIADQVYQRLLGEPGYFDTRIAYVSVAGRRADPITRIAVMDQDGANNRYLTGGEWLVHTPRWNPVRNEVAFLSYANDRPRVYVLDLGSGRQRLLGEFSGISFAPRYAPSGAEVVLSATRGAGSDIFVVGASGGTPRQLTNSGAIDTSPCYSPDGSQIVFVSDRGGSPQIYVMGAGGGGARRISYGSGQYGAPVWSPRGDLIAFVRIGGGGFSLGVMGPDGSGERILQQGFTIDSPSFCPNGRVLAYCVQTRSSSGGAGFSSRIEQIDIAGFNERPLRAPGGAEDPAWSPLPAS